MMGLPGPSSGLCERLQPPGPGPLVPCLNVKAWSEDPTAPISALPCPESDEYDSSNIWTRASNVSK